MRPPVLLTGATGFLGMEVLARLAEQGDREVHCLVRAGDAAEAEARLDEALALLWDDPDTHRGRIHAVAGDIAQPGLGLAPARRGAISEEIGAVLHCAAAIAFDLPLDEARAVNVEGVREIVGLAREARMLGRLDRFLHVSTAFVCGRHQGLFAEGQLDVGQAFRNTYERTKWEAEHVVAAAEDLAPVIARPSIVMGEAASGWTPSFNVLYRPLAAFSRGLVETVPSVAHATVDVVPVDYVADALLVLLDAGGPAVTNLVAGTRAVAVEELIGLAAEHFGHPMPRLEPGNADGRAAAGAAYLPYFELEVAFDDAAARAALEPAGLRAPPLADYFGVLMDYAQASRWGKAPMTREAARRRVAAASA